MSTKVALITGGAKGIGRGIALDLATQKWNIAFCYRTSDAEAEKTAAAITERGGQARAIRCDVSDPAAAKQMVEQVEKEWGHIDVLVNGAGPYHRVNLFEETVEGWNEMFDGNLHPIFYLAQAVAPGMKANKSGRIINFSMANADQMISQPDVTAHYIDPNPCQTSGSTRHHRKRRIAWVHQFRQRAAGGTGRHDKTDSCWLHRNS